ncbi:Levodione reductase [Leucoagaricus sp. SymC.cos]|nr:Levodione reductase [Leucoagaricus sp. SymC.cos]
MSWLRQLTLHGACASGEVVEDLLKLLKDANTVGQAMLPNLERLVLKGNSGTLQHKTTMSQPRGVPESFLLNDKVALITGAATNERCVIDISRHLIASIITSGMIVTPVHCAHECTKFWAGTLQHKTTMSQPRGVPESFLLNDKVALITGAASGIGFATAKAFLDANIQGLLLVDLSQDALDHALERLSVDERARCSCLVADVSSETMNYANRAVELWGQLDIAVLNAGILNEPTSLLDTDVKVWDKIMEVNGRGVFLGLQQCGRAMVGRKSGSIVITSSQLGLQGAPLYSAYGASKWAVRGLALTAAEELTPLGIRVNSVCPGPTITPLIDSMKSGDGWDRMADATLMKRLGEAREIANAVLYLASDAASYVVYLLCSDFGPEKTLFPAQVLLWYDTQG